MNLNETLAKWIETKEEINDARYHLDQLRQQETMLANEIGGMLTPPDAATDEKFLTWYAGKLFTAQKTFHGGYLVEERLRPKGQTGA